MLFNMVLDEFLDSLSNLDAGVEIGTEGVKIPILAYPDDLLIFGSSVGKPNIY